PIVARNTAAVAPLCQPYPTPAITPPRAVKSSHPVSSEARRVAEDASATTPRPDVTDPASRLTEVRKGTPRPAAIWPADSTVRTSPNRLGPPNRASITKKRKAMTRAEASATPLVRAGTRCVQSLSVRLGSGIPSLDWGLVKQRGHRPRAVGRRAAVAF